LLFVAALFFKNVFMGEVKNLYNAEAVKKVKELVDASNTCLFTTSLSDKPLATRPMATVKVDDDGNLWFFSQRYSNKNKEIKEDERVQLFYANNSAAEYLSIYGQADISDDEEKINKLWDPLAKTWFHDGKEDPDITVIEVRPKEIYYWDTKHGKMVSLLKIIAGAVTGITMDDGEEGRIKL
jgi:general stress protein 26